MCNLCKDRLFIIPNPCCCCSLKCGAIWAGVIDFLYGAISLLVPAALGVGYDVEVGSQNLRTTSRFSNGLILGKRWAFLMEEPVKSFITYGAYSVQASTGLYLAMCIQCFGSPFHKFISGCVWLIGRALITAAWTQLLYGILSEKENIQEPYWRNYTYILIVNILFHIFLFIVIRFYTMQAYDTWKYRPLEPERSKKRDAADVRTEHEQKRNLFARIAEAIEKKKKHQEEAATGQHAPQIHGHRWDDAPVWRICDDYPIYGENYEHWDPVRYFERWQRLENTGLLKLGAEAVFDDVKYRHLVKKGGTSSMQLFDTVDEKASVSSSPSTATVAGVHASRSGLPSPVRIIQSQSKLKHSTPSVASATSVEKHKK